MVYRLHCLLSDNDYLLFHEKSYSEKEFKKIIDVVRFELGYHDNIDSIIKILCSNYEFKLVNTISI